MSGHRNFEKLQVFKFKTQQPSPMDREKNVNVQKHHVYILFLLQAFIFFSFFF